jgi:hypothetical protein
MLLVVTYTIHRPAADILHVVAYYLFGMLGRYPPRSHLATRLLRLHSIFVGQSRTFLLVYYTSIYITFRKEQ